MFLNCFEIIKHLEKADPLRISHGSAFDFHLFLHIVAML